MLSTPTTGEAPPASRQRSVNWPMISSPSTADREDCPGSAVPGAEGELPVGKVRILEPLVRAGVDGELGAGADSADFGGHKDLVGGRGRQVHFADVRLVRPEDDGLECAHDV